jgi:CheY-like chemotaxis protein/HPt (histidine-containing phosphotransfer) domain-containing protein
VTDVAQRTTSVEVATTPHSKDSVDPGSGTIPGNILVVEDNPVSRRVAEAMLRELGFQADVVVDGAEAVKAATVTAYRAILMDCQIPVLDGYQATLEIRRQEGVLRRTPIIAVTSSAISTNQERCMAAGMDDYLAKPLRSFSLAAVLAHWVPDGSGPSITVDPAEPPPETRLYLDPMAVAAHHVLDPDVVRRLEQLGIASGEDLIGQLADLFVEDASTRVEAMRKGLAGEDYSAVSRAAHSLSGAGGNVGAAHLATLCDTLATDIEADMETSDLRRGWRLLDAIEAEVGRVDVALASLRPPA